MMLSRRALMAYGMGLGMTWAFRPVLAQESVSVLAGGPHEGFLRLGIGDVNVIALQDGTVRRALDEGFVRNAPLDQVQATLSAQDLPTDHIMVPYTPFVVEAAGKRYLLDTGFADNGPEGTGLLHQNMRKAGIDPASIDVVLMSHLHGDHINGLRRKDGALVYPDALVYIPQPELDHWMNDSKMAAAPEAAQGGFRTVRRVLIDYPEDSIVAFQPGETLDGIFRSQGCFGHAPGQTAFTIGSGAESFSYIADVAHYPALFVTNPDWHVQFDMDPVAAQATRHTVLGQMSAMGGLVAGYHFPFPSVGSIDAVRLGENYSFSNNFAG